jgi:hypothetical protein
MSMSIPKPVSKIERAGIQFNKETFGGQKYSVAWDEMSIKRQDDKIVVALDESVIDRVQNAEDRIRRDELRVSDGAFERHQHFRGFGGQRPVLAVYPFMDGVAAKCVLSVAL